MSQSIAINGIKLHEVQMPLEPFGRGYISFLRYPKPQIHFSREGMGIKLEVPAYLAVELYRVGILPQDTQIPIQVKIGGRSAGWFVVSEVLYPHGNDGPFGRVTFLLSRVPRARVRTEADEPPVSEPPPEGNGTYVMDITHFLDEHGQLASMPAPARKLASFLVLLIEAATQAFPAQDHDTGIRCRMKGCEGSMRTSLSSPEEEISWYCPACGHHGVIRNWENTKWNQLKSNEQGE